MAVQTQISGNTATGFYQERNDIKCPQCGTHHVDEGEWAKRLHRTHKCAACAHEWQPHECYTFGVKQPLSLEPSNTNQQ